METNHDSAVGPTSVSAPLSASSTVNGSSPDSGVTVGGHRSRKGWLYRRIMRSGVVEPFRKVLRPLLVWALRPHFGVLGESESLGKVMVNLKPTSTFAIVMSIILGPLVCVMLLPLVLVLIPVWLCVGVIAMIATSVQREA